MKLLILMMILVAGVHPHAVVPWAITLPQQDVPLGQFATVHVTGPTSASFVLNVSGQPFNASVPVFSYPYTLPYNANSATTSINATVPTSLLEIGAYQVTIRSEGIIVATTIVYLIDPVNGTALQQNLTNAENEINAQRGQIASLGQTVYAQAFQLWALLIWGIVFPITFVSYLIIKDRHQKYPHLFNRTARAFSNTFTKAGDLHDFHSGVEKKRTTQPDPARKWRCLFDKSCNLCRYGLFNDFERDRHLFEEHNIEDPVKGVHYVLAKEAVKQTVVTETKRTPNPKGRQQSIQNIHFDMRNL